jgi:hypothetical protein
VSSSPASETTHSAPPPVLPRRSSVSKKPPPPIVAPKPRIGQSTRQVPASASGEVKNQPQSQFAMNLATIKSGRNALNRMGVSDKQIMQGAARAANGAMAQSKSQQNGNSYNGAMVQSKSQQNGDSYSGAFNSFNSIKNALVGQEQPPVVSMATKPKPSPKPAVSRPPVVAPKPRAPMTNSGTKPSSFNISSKFTLFAQNVPEDIPLNLATGWFFQESDSKVIPYLVQQQDRVMYKASGNMASLGMGSWIFTYIFAIRWTNSLSRTWVRLQWKTDAPMETIESEQTHKGPPSPLRREELVKYSELYGPHVVQWCTERIGQRVGNGECWTVNLPNVHSKLTGNSLPKVHC